MATGAKKRPRRSFTDEFKAGAVRLVLDEGKTVSQVGRDLDVAQSVIGNWVKQARADRSDGKTGLTTEERAELTRLRREVRDLRMQRDILKNYRVRPIGPPVGPETPEVGSIASREEWPSAFWCSANP